MRSADAAWLRMDRPANLMVINSLEWFDTVPDWAGVRAAFLDRIVARFDRFRQVPESGIPVQLRREGHRRLPHRRRRHR
jgi:hypothetical protein